MIPGLRHGEKALSLGCLRKLRLGALAALSLAAAQFAQASEIAVSTPGKTVVRDAAGDLLLRNCDRARRESPCTLPPGAPRAPAAWVDIESAEIVQLDAKTVELSVTVRAPIPTTPAVPSLIYYWQFQDGCNTASPTDKDGLNVFWNGRQWTAQWFVIESCSPRRIAIGQPVPFRFAGNTVTVRAALADLITRGGTALLWFAGTRLVPFNHPIFKRSLPVDAAPDAVALDPANPETPLHPEAPAPWVPR